MYYQLTVATPYVQAQCRIGPVRWFINHGPQY